MDKVTVITVCFNAEKTIENTIKSVLAQTYGSLEYLIIDGVSSDATLQIAEKYRPRFLEKGIEYHIVSEKDTGIYNAMNKGIRMATGEWINFMNADDTFFDGDVIADLFGTSRYEGFDAVYGDCHRLDGQGSYFMSANPIETLPKQMPFMHQSIFVRTPVCQRYLFDERYRLCADYDLFFRMYADGVKFFQAKLVICNYSVRGASGKQELKAQDEVIQIKRENQDRFPISLRDTIGWRLSRIKKTIKQWLPETILQKIRAAKHMGRLR